MEWIFNFMNTDPGRQVTLGDLATVAGTDASYLCRVFRQHLGHGPMEVLYVFRITKSLVGLRAGRKLESLAQSLGFYDTSHFVKRFKAFFGKTPSQMQKALAKGYKPKLPKWPFMGG